MSFVKFNNQDLGQSLIDFGGSTDSIPGDKEDVLSENSNKKRKFPIMIVTIGILVLINICCVPLAITHLLNCQHSTNTQPESLNSTQFYLFGADRHKPYSTLISFVSRLNTSTGEWASFARMPNDEYEMCGAVSGKKIYLFGGHSPKETLSNATFVYDSSTNHYSSLQPMPVPRKSCGAAVLNGSVYVAGGLNEKDEAVSSMFRYDIQTDQWSNVSSMNSPRHLIQLVQLRGRLYAIGLEKSVEVYDPSADRWSFVTNRSSAQTEHTNPGVAVHDGKIYVLDGHVFEVYSPVTNQWETLQAPENYKFRNLFYANGKFWTVGAALDEDTYWNTSNAVFTYEISTQQWTRQVNGNIPHWHLKAFAVDH